MSASLPLPLRLALRELREGLSGFRIFLACLILGVAAIAGVGSLSSALIAGMQEEGKALLAADAELRLFQRQLDAPQRAWLEETGTLSETLRLRTNAFAPDSGERALAELRAVDDLYPFYGALELTPAIARADVFRQKEGRWGAALDPTLADRLNLSVGDPLKLGRTLFEVRALIANEPDRANYGFQLGPTVMVDWEAMEDTGLVSLGSLTNYYYKLKLGADDGIAAWREALEEAFPEADWRVRTRDNSAPGVRRFVDRMGSFLTLVGLTALVVGGVGVGNAVRAYLDRKTDTIATLKILGAQGGTVFAVYMSQVLILTAVAVVVGLGLGAGLPFALAELLSERLPVPPRVGLYPGPLLTAAVYGTLITLVFTAWPLGRARDVPVARLFRALVAPESSRPRLQYVLLSAGAALLVVAAAIALAEQRWLAAGFALGAGGALGLLRATGTGIERLAAKLPRPRSPGLRLAIANLHRPGAATGPVVVSLGLGLTLFAALALVEGNMNRQVAEQIPKRAPAFFFVDIQPYQYEDFLETARGLEGVGGIATVPSLRGTITRVDGVPSEQVEPEPGSGWVLRGDRGISYAADFPEGNTLVAGDWWPPDYEGPPLISFVAEEGRGLGLEVGDTLTVSVLGREITAEIASLRHVDWGTFGFNFVLLFDPHTLAQAPHSYMATLEAEGAAEERAYRTLTDRFPNVTAVRLKEVLASVNDILTEIAAAVRVTAVVAIVAGVLVLAGAMAAGHRHRVYDSVIMKVLGAVRRDVLRAYVIEYALLGLITGAVALALGGLAGWVVVDRVMAMEFTLLPLAMALTVAVSVIATVAFGLVSTWTALGVRPAQALRAA